jgi:hypothetical protein
MQCERRLGVVCIEACFGELAVSPDRGRTKAAQDGKGIKVIRKDRLRRKGMTTIEEVTVPRGRGRGV